MELMERIEIRLMHADRDQTVEELSDELSRIDRKNGEIIRIQLFSHPTIETDLCIHLTCRSGADRGASKTGLKLAAGLEAVGFVRHTLWLCEKQWRLLP